MPLPAPSDSIRCVVDVERPKLLPRGTALPATTIVKKREGPDQLITSSVAALTVRSRYRALEAVGCVSDVEITSGGLARFGQKNSGKLLTRGWAGATVVRTWAPVQPSISSR